ncbi:uncharacterized protein LOC127802122 [Diospyros lotus]|uniref:uncharacterized protein LOC127802122 n=1 Tax=Diospyros lotus TaxID=55363 RepID=UPI00225C3211|nr:uncharacterized protein LOC127802122 [Diospyros lotus]
MALVSLKQNQGEPLKDFVSRFNMESLSIENFDHSSATKYINAEEVMQAKRAEHAEKREKKKHPEERKNEDWKEKHHPRWDSSGFTPLNVPRGKILATIEGLENGSFGGFSWDLGSSLKILYRQAFLNMGYQMGQLKPARVPLVGFDEEGVYSDGVIQLPLVVGKGSRTSQVMLDILVADVPVAYNMILGRSGLNALRAIPSTYHMMMKFPTINGIGEVRGDLCSARECYIASIGMAKDAREKEIVLREKEAPRRDSRGKKKEYPPKEVSFLLKGLEDSKTTEPVDRLEEIPLKEDCSDRCIRMSAELKDPLRGWILALLRQYVDIFAWTVQDMPGVDPEQKKRSFAPDRVRAIEAEVAKLEEAQYIREVNYPEWLANVVLVPKGESKWRLCIDFTDLNKAFPKDSYPFSRIDALIDGTAGCLFMSFLDAFQGYHQISLHPEDQEKTTFITNKATYCYIVMPFGLKNAGATYQRLVNKFFQHRLGRNMEAYVDDMLVKRLVAEHHPKDLEECFKTLHKFYVKLNLVKCAFGVSVGKFLFYIVYHRGIEVNPAKVKAIMDMLALRNVKEVQSLTGRMTVLGRFLSRLAEKGLPFYKVLSKAKNFIWNVECQEAFDKLKKHLATPPILTKPQSGEPLYIYLAVAEEAVSSVLVQEEDKKQRPVYYASKRLTEAEVWYSPMEKLAFALIILARKLRPYFQAHTIIVLTNQPLRQVLNKPELSGRMLKWAMELIAFDIEYKPRPAIKAQALLDFIAEGIGSSEASEEDQRPWILVVDGSSTLEGDGVGLMIKSPDGQLWPYAFHFEFQASNNEAEYEALLAGLRLAEQLGARRVEVSSDSNLVVQQVNGEYEARGAHMARYLAMVRDLIARFQYVKVEYVPRAMNTKADLLSRIASSSFPTSSREILIESLSQKSIEEVNDQLCVDGKPSWMDHLLLYLREEKLPEDDAEAREVRRKARSFVLVNGELYQRSFS